LIYQLKPEAFARHRSLFSLLDLHLAIATILDGGAAGEIFVDDPERPHSGLARIGRRFFLSGEANNPGFNASLRTLFINQIYPRSLASGDEAFNLYYAAEDWEKAVGSILRGKNPIKLKRSYYELRTFQSDWRKKIPAGFEIRPVDPLLLGQAGLKNLDRLREEMVSECPSVQEFLETKFGVCAVKENEVAGWCLSEYNRVGRCEVGIETVEAFQKQGIGKVLACALCERALASGMHRIGWHCYASNLPSSATALAAGFGKVKDYNGYLALFDEAANLGVNGNFCFREQHYGEAAAWYERAIQTGRAPAWVSENLEKVKKISSQ
jgi:RimJ/RimL family protein N-acetyltransferase